MSFVTSSWNGLPSPAHKSAWHWLMLHGKSVAHPVYWNAESQAWSQGSHALAPNEISKIYSYQGIIQGSMVMDLYNNQKWIV